MAKKTKAESKKAEPSLADRIDRLRDTGMSMEAIAAALDVALATIYRWRSRNIRPHRSLLKALDRLEIERAQEGKR